MRNKKTARKMKVENHSLTHFSNNSQSIVQNKTDTKNEHISYTTIIKENQLFEKYYRQLNLIHESDNPKLHDNNSINESLFEIDKKILEILE